MGGKVFDRILNIRLTATKKEKVLIEKLQSVDKTDLIYMSITDLAEKLSMAEATIIRFCRKIGYKGFQDFKLNLSQDLALESSNIPDDKAKYNLNNMCDALNTTCEQLDYRKCLDLAKRIVDARKVCFFGVGNSSIPTLAAKLRLIKVGIHVETYVDNHIQTIVVSNLNKDDVVVLVSTSGCTKDIIQIASIAKNNHSYVGVITNYEKSPLAKYADNLIYSSRREAPHEGGTLSTVVSQIYIVDMICVAIYEILGNESIERAVKSSLEVSDKAI